MLFVILTYVYLTWFVGVKGIENMQFYQHLLSGTDTVLKY